MNKLSVLRINTDPAPIEAIRAVYVGTDKPIFVPRGCIETNCPGFDGKAVVEDAINLLDIAMGKDEQLSLIPKQGDDPAPEVKETAHYMADKLAAGACEGECPLSVSFEGCWRREDVGLFSLVKVALGRRKENL